MVLSSGKTVLGVRGISSPIGGRRGIDNKLLPGGCSH